MKGSIGLSLRLCGSICNGDSHRRDSPQRRRAHREEIDWLGRKQNHSSSQPGLAYTLMKSGEAITITIRITIGSEEPPIAAPPSTDALAHRSPIADHGTTDHGTTRPPATVAPNSHLPPPITASYPLPLSPPHLPPSRLPLPSSLFALTPYRLPPCSLPPAPPASPSLPALRRA